MTISEDKSKICSDRDLLFQKNKDYYNFKKMIAQQRLPVHLEYLQPNLTSPESKASPLALLAATCSSIGKPDNEKKDSKVITSNYSNKMVTGDQEVRSTLEHIKTENKLSNGDLTPSLTRTSSISTSNSAIMSILETEKHSEDYKKYSKEHSEGFKAVSRYCHPHTAHDKYNLPHLPSHHLHDHHRDCTHCKQPPRMDTYSPLRAPIPTSLCQCAACVRLHSEQKCVYPHLASMPYPASYKYSMPPSVASSCRDPNCTNCSKMSNKNVQNFLHPALVQQCTHSSLPKSAYTPPPGPPGPPSTHLSSQENQTKSKPYVCNWVSNGIHCGLSYTNSDDLFQHLRTHTSLQQQQQNEIDNRTIPSSSLTQSGSSSAPLHTSNITQGTCRIHGCPCSLSPKKVSPRPGYNYGHFESSSFRYSPYTRPLPHVGGANYTGHSYPPHGFHY